MGSPDGGLQFGDRTSLLSKIVDMPSTRPVVDARAVTRWYGEATALDQVSLLVPAGDVHGLVGPNGAGKTTLLSILFGLVLPSEGDVRLFGRTRAEAGRGWLDGVAGFVESPRFYPYLSGRRNLRVLAGLDRGDSSDLVDDALTLVGLRDASEQKVKGYSLGMRQRLGLAAAVVRRPRLLVLDEPTNGMDPAGSGDLRQALRRRASDGMTVVLSSHDMTEVEKLCDAVTVLSHGEVAYTGAMQGLRDAAPDPMWHLRTSDDAKTLRMARSTTGLVATTSPGTGLDVTAAQPRLDAFVLTLAKSDVAVRELVQAVSPLERLMEELVGQARDPRESPARATAGGDA
jgi:ABC-2 type transport system ATP-binding protein